MNKFQFFRDDWKTATLGELETLGHIKLGRGKVISKKDIYNSPGPFPVYSSSAQNNGLFGTYGYFMFDEEMITWSVDGGGYFFYRPKHKFSVTNVTGYLTVDSDVFDYRFLYYLLDLQHSYLSFDYVGKAHPSVIRPLYHIPLIDISYQRNIAQVLTAVDQAIQQTEALIAKYQRIKTGLMQDLLTRGIDENGDLRHPARHEFKEVEGYGRVPQKWQIRALSEVAQIGTGITLGRNIEGQNVIELPYLRVANVQDGYLDLTEVKTVRVYRHEIERYLLQPGDVLMNEGGDYDKLGRGTVWYGQIAQCLHQNHVFRVRTHRTVLLPEYLALFSESPFGKKFFILNSRQSTNLASINSTQLKAFLIPIPNLDEQKKIITVLSTCDHQIQKEHSFLNKLMRIKSGLMQDLLSGKVSIAPLLTDGQGN
jgi:restriction endonuclease S subunit